MLSVDLPVHVHQCQAVSFVRPSTVRLMQLPSHVYHALTRRRACLRPANEEGTIAIIHRRDRDLALNLGLGTMLR